MWNRTRLAVPLAVVACLALHAAPASAHDDDDGWHRPPPRYEHHERGWERHGYYHGHAPRYYGPPRYVARPYPVYPVYRPYPVYEYAPAPTPYYCGPCGHYFASYPALSFHVQHHHHVAVISLPSVIFQASFGHGGGAGWVFGGF